MKDVNHFAPSNPEEKKGKKNLKKKRKININKDAKACGYYGSVYVTRGGASYARYTYILAPDFGRSPSHICTAG